MGLLFWGLLHAITPLVIVELLLEEFRGVIVLDSTTYAIVEKTETIFKKIILKENKKILH
jgi:hypothetical protein